MNNKFYTVLSALVTSMWFVSVVYTFLLALSFLCFLLNRPIYIPLSVIQNLGLWLCCIISTQVPNKFFKAQRKVTILSARANSNSYLKDTTRLLVFWSFVTASTILLTFGILPLKYLVTFELSDHTVIKWLINHIKKLVSFKKSN